MSGHKWFRILLDDYSTPAFITATKEYFGSLDDIKIFIDSLRNNEICKYGYSDTIAAFDAFLNGDEKAVHTTSYSKTQLLTPVKVFYHEEHELNNYKWDHLNTWMRPYSMKLELAKVYHLWIKYKDKYCRILKAQIKGLSYEGVKGEWIPLEGDFWGFPGMIIFNEGMLSNQLACIEKKFNSLEELQKDYEDYTKCSYVDFKGLCDDIFGDG